MFGHRHAFIPWRTDQIAEVAGPDIQRVPLLREIFVPVIYAGNAAIRMIEHARNVEARDAKSSEPCPNRPPQVMDCPWLQVLQVAVLPSIPEGPVKARLYLAVSADRPIPRCSENVHADLFPPCQRFLSAFGQDLLRECRQRHDVRAARLGQFARSRPGLGLVNIFPPHPGHFGASLAGCERHLEELNPRLAERAELRP